MRHTRFALASVLSLWMGATAATAQPLGTSFTYQGELRSAGEPAAGAHDLRFRLYDAASGGVQVGPTLCVDNVDIADGRFAVLLDFGAVFAGQARHLEIDVRADTGLACSNPSGFVTLTPRQRLTGTPNALFALHAATATNAAAATTAVTATNASQLNGQPAVFYQSATNLTAGILPSGRLDGLYTGEVTFNNAGNLFVGQFSGSGIGLLNLNAGAIETGTLSPARLPSGGAWALANPLNVDAGTLYIDPIGDRVGVGTTAPNSFSKMHVAGDQDGVWGVASAASGTYFGVFGTSGSTSGRGVVGSATASSGNTIGVSGSSASPSGIGVQGSHQSSSGSAPGVLGLTNSTSADAVGVLGEVTSASAGSFSAGVRGINRSTSAGGIGVWGSHAGVGWGVYGLSVSGVGVFGLSTATSGSAYGGQFESNSTSGRGVLAAAIAGTGTTYGVFASNNSTSGRGVFGIASAGTGSTYGVYGQTTSTGGIGVYGIATAGSGLTHGGYFEAASTAGRGVLGSISAGSGTNYGVQGFNSGLGATAWAVFASGRFGASGTKSFRIDHPEDPENKYLLHYAAESPEVMNFYSGMATLDGAGEAVVELPGYFARINRDPRYTLTAVGVPMPLLHVAEEIDAAGLEAGALAEPGAPVAVSRFVIGGGVPGGKVSWRVEAVRNDRWVRMRGAPVEVEKDGVERGAYQHPDLYGMPAERGMIRASPALDGATTEDMGEEEPIAAVTSDR